MRISRALALAGIDSRRKCEVHVQNGAVVVNGEVVRDLGRQVDLNQDVILFRGRPIQFEKFVYFMMNKPVGYVTTASDEQGKKTVYDLLPHTLVRSTRQPSQSRTRVFPVGRLDRDTMGLLLFTNDGDLANRLLHPRYGVGKWYEIRLDRPIDAIDIRKVLEGVRLEDGWANAEKLSRVSRRCVRILIREGKKREVRRIFEALNYRVMGLCRIAFGPLMLGNLSPGEGRYLKTEEVLKLKSSESAKASLKPPKN